MAERGASNEGIETQSMPSARPNSQASAPVQPSANASRGFTVLELVFIVAIAAILATLAMGQYNQYIEAARGRAATGEIVALSTQVERYRTTHDGANPDALADMGRDGMLDPWGRPYVYTNLATAKGKGSARKDRRLNPLNSDYDLFSAGKNGVFKPQISQKDSLDDIIRARDGAFVGRASDF